MRLQNEPDKIAALDRLSDEDYLWSFESATLDPHLWTHYAHMRMAWLYLNSLSYEAAADKIRSGILRYNTVALGRPEAYHETITLFFAHLTWLRMCRGESWSQFAARHEELCKRSSIALRRHYSAKQLFGGPARQEWVSPDLAPLPRPERLNQLVAAERSKQGE